MNHKNRLSAAIAKLQKTQGVKRVLPKSANEAPVVVKRAPRDPDQVVIRNEDELWTEVVNAMRKANKSRTQANVMEAMTKLKEFEYENGLPSMMFGKSSDRFRSLYAALVQYEEEQKDIDLEKYAPEILDEFAALYDKGEVEIPSLAKRAPNDGFRGQTIRPQIGDVIRGGFTFFVYVDDKREYGKADQNSPQMFVVEHAGYGRGKLTDVWVVEVSPLIDPRNGDPRQHNPLNDRLYLMISSKPAGEDVARYTGRLVHDNPNGVVVVSQMYRTFVAYNEAQLREFDRTAIHVTTKEQ